jgi:hypothetical protein
MGDRKSVDAKMSGRGKGKKVGKTRIKNYAPSIADFKSEGK